MGPSTRRLPLGRAGSLLRADFHAGYETPSALSSGEATPPSVGLLVWPVVPCG